MTTNYILYNIFKTANFKSFLKFEFVYEYNIDIFKYFYRIKQFLIIYFILFSSTNLPK